MSDKNKKIEDLKKLLLKEREILLSKLNDLEHKREISDLFEDEVDALEFERNIKTIN